MYSKGIYRNNETGKIQSIFLNYGKNNSELLLTEGTMVNSACSTDGLSMKCYNSKEAMRVYQSITNLMSKCSNKNGNPVPFPLGTAVLHEFSTRKENCQFLKYNKELASCNIISEDYTIELEFVSLQPDQLFYDMAKGIQYTAIQSQILKVSDTDDIPVRSLDEIALEKDLTWLQTKKYYVVNDDAVAEQIFQILDNANCVVSYDTETTGLHINMFSKVNSKYAKMLEEYNSSRPENEQIRADKLVGIIFCVENDVSYYFPVGNRKFKNLYETDTEVRMTLIKNFKAEYTVGAKKDYTNDIARYWRDTPMAEIRPDVVLMERCRNILTTKQLVAHNGSFEWKVSWCYDIDINLCDDTMIMHQLMYKFRSTTSNKGEPSNLKYLTKRELGIDQLDLNDFFADYKEDKDGLIRGGKKKGARIDFSYMDYEGSRAYAPADGDTTLQIYKKYKADMLQNHKDLVYLYQIEVMVCCAIGYMEFYGIKLDEEHINDVCEDKKTELLEIEMNFRDSVNYSTAEEKAMRSGLDTLKEELKEIVKEETRLSELVRKLNFDKIKGLDTPELETQTSLLEAQSNSKKAKQKEIDDYRKKIYNLIENSTNQVNLGSPAQVAHLFFEELGIECPEEKISVGKKVLKSLRKMKNEDGTQKYPMIELYSQWKDTSTLITKFFDKLPQFMFPNGFIFPSFGQISTATGRMSCSKPNAQQFCKAVTSLVVPRDNNILIDADFSQIEYRTLVAMANEPALIEKFRDPDSDYHTTMASLMFGVPYASVTKQMRSEAKSFNFGIPYGMGLKSLAILLSGIGDEAHKAEAKVKYELYFKEQPNVRAFFDRVKESALVHKYTKTLWNRRRYYSFTNEDGSINNEKKAYAQRQAGNAIIQGTAADIFKISVARNFSFIRANGLLGKLLIINMVHDEQLMEIDCNYLNPLACYKNIADNMQFQIEGFPPLYIGAGFGFNWKYAKGGDAEIHPDLCKQLCKEAENMPIWLTRPVAALDVFNYFQNRVNTFRLEKVKNYMSDKNNWGEKLHPVIGSLLTGDFSKGLKKEPDESEEDFLKRIIEKFISDNNLDVKASYFLGNETSVEEEEDKEYFDDEEDIDDIDEFESEFKLIDESNKMFGANIQDLINMFGYFISPQKKVCGIKVSGMSRKKITEISEYLTTKVVQPTDDGAMELCFLKDGNMLVRTGVYVANINADSFK